MSNKIIKYLLLSFLFVPSVVFASNTNGTINSTDKYAWSENAGWIDFGTTEGNVQITDSALTGYAWSENAGWISLNCLNTDSCSNVDYKVANNGNGTLTGYAWSENAGWINFNPTYGGVTINSSGEFLGYAWSENMGWIVFNCTTTDSCSVVDYKVKTDWNPQSIRPQCNNSLDDDGDGKIDYPNDGGCASLEDNNEVDLVSGGSIPVEWYNPPILPVGGDFGITINNGSERSKSLIITLNLVTGSNTTNMAISNFSDFRDAVQEAYSSTKTWNLCDGRKSCLDGDYVVYAKFYAPGGVASKVVSDSISYKKEIVEPIIELPVVEVEPPVKPSKPISQMTKAEITIEIARIVDLIKQLQAELAKMIGGATYEGIPAKFKFTVNLKYGQSGDDVKHLQIFLKTQRQDIYPEGVVSSWFGPQTEKAVIRFQEKYASEILTPSGLSKGTGVVGVSTRNKLNELLGE